MVILGNFGRFFYYLSLQLIKYPDFIGEMNCEKWKFVEIKLDGQINSDSIITLLYNLDKLSII
jgi:hypothetical protein